MEIGMAHRIDFLLQVASHIEQQVSLGETRAGLLLAASGALAAAYATAVQATDFWSLLGPFGQSLFESAVAALGVTIILGLLSVRPALVATRFGERRLQALDQPKSIVYFSSIATQEPNDLIAFYRNMTDKDIEDDLLRVLHGKSLKAREKFTDLYCVTLCLSFSIALFGLSLLTLAVSAGG
jgi:hypothetical protein